MSIKLRIIKRFSILVLPLLLNACGTVMAHRDSMDVTYAGIEYDIDTMRRIPEAAPLYALDLPLSLAADTLILPVTLSIGPRF